MVEVIDSSGMSLLFGLGVALAAVLAWLGARGARPVPVAVPVRKRK